MALGTGLSPLQTNQATAQTPAQPDAQPQRSSALPLAGKVALVTGAARGIGRATAIELARQGADVALLDIADPRGVNNIYGYRLSNREELDETMRLVTAEGRRAVPIVADVRNLDAMKQAANTAVSQLGRIDILVANAGIAIWSPFAEMKPDQWQSVIDVNLTGVANSMWAVIPQMQKQQSGRIITLTSIGGRMGVAGVANYSATKWGVIGLTKSAALELGKDNITVNAVAPTAVNTPLYRSEGQYQSTGMGSFAEQDRAMLGYHSLQVPAIEPEDIGKAIVFLGSDEARYISGTVLDVAAGGNARYTA
ncbi:mycofactocin-coupled SDR family oxidoreductase [Phormidium tenue FACHB-886]|nr:mycofactocin-coupled SDR family oxidoreductase [Phormidium tenue FACHB-886]